MSTRYSLDRKDGRLQRGQSPEYSHYGERSGEDWPMSTTVNGVLLKGVSGLTAAL